MGRVVVKIEKKCFPSLFDAVRAVETFQCSPCCLLSTVCDESLRGRVNKYRLFWAHAATWVTGDLGSFPCVKVRAGKRIFLRFSGYFSYVAGWAVEL